MTHEPVIRRVTVPACDEHEGILSSTVRLLWVCPICQGPRGDVYPTVSYDGSRRLDCDGWMNLCGHIDKYAAIRAEAKRNGLNAPRNQDVPSLDDLTPDDEAALRATADSPLTIDVSWMNTTVSAEDADAILLAANAVVEAKFGPHEDDEADTPSVLVGEEAQEIPCETCGKLFWSLDPDHTECRACDEAANAVMFLTFEEADFMHQVCQFDGLIVYGSQLNAITMAAKLERGGLVQVQRCGGFVIVSAVRPESED